LEKGNISLKDFIALAGAPARIRIYQGEGDQPEMIYSGCRANLIHEKELMEVGHIVKHFTYKPEYSKRSDPYYDIKETIPVTEENAGQYNYADLREKIFCDIYIF
jgi:hypothetical protein